VCDSVVNCLSWDPNGYRLLTGGSSLLLWCDTVSFSSACEAHPQAFSDESAGLLEEDDISAERGLYLPVWRMAMASPVHHIRFSPGYFSPGAASSHADGRLFASAATIDRALKVWHLRQCEYPQLNANLDQVFPYPCVHCATQRCLVMANCVVRLSVSPAPPRGDHAAMAPAPAGFHVSIACLSSPA
jgi:hypothetical protein